MSSIDKLVDELTGGLRDVLEQHLPDGFESYDDNMEELENLREEKEKFDEKVEELEMANEKQKQEYDAMLIDLIKVNLNNAVLSPHAYVRQLALQVAKEMAEKVS